MPEPADPSAGSAKGESIEAMAGRLAGPIGEPRPAWPGANVRPTPSRHPQQFGPSGGRLEPTLVSPGDRLSWPCPKLRNPRPALRSQFRFVKDGPPYGLTD